MIASFACKKISLEQIILCSFEISKTMFKILVYLLKRKEPITIVKIAEDLSLERSTVQKSISALLQKNLIARRQINLKSGGYRFTYFAKDKNDIKNKILMITEKWYSSVKNTVESW